MTEQWQELKETIIELRDNDGTGTQQEVCKFLANLMDVLEKQITDGWIPCSERLPEERIAVLVWCPERKNIYCACYEEKQWWIFGAYFKKVELDVIAWMPLPAPYKEDE